MSNPSSTFVASDKCEKVGPDYFGYYTSEVVNLLSCDDDDFLVAPQTLEVLESKYEERRKKNLVNHCDNCPDPLYSNGVGVGLSDFKKDRLKSLLRQSAIALSSEVDEVVDPVFAAYHLQSKLKSKSYSLSDTTTTSKDVVQVPCKKLKVSSSSTRFPGQSTNVNPLCNRKASEDLQFLLENDSVEVAEMVKKCSNELSRTLGYMEEQLELLLDTVMFKCRSMTLAEKQQLQSLIQKLPGENLDRIVELICRNRPVEEQNCDKIVVDLEKEDNATLWRLYYYVEAVEKAKCLSCGQEA